MRNKRVPEAMITSPKNVFRHPNSVITITDNSETPIPVVNSDNYSVFQPIYSPKGVTGEVVLIEGTDIVGTYVSLFGKPNKVKYGPMSTIAYNAALSGFNVGVINMPAPGARYANVYLAFEMKKMMSDDGITAKQATIYVTQNSNTQEYHIAFSRAEIEEWLADRKDQDTINEINVEGYEFGFTINTVEDLEIETDYDEYLSETAYNINVTDKAEIDAESEIHVPVFAIAYRGASSYGNGFTLEIQDQLDLLNNKYPYFNAVIKDKTETKYEFPFALFDVPKGTLNYSFSDRGTETCQKIMTPTNAVQEFRTYSIERKKANKLEAAMKLAGEKQKKYLVAKIKEKYPAFDATTSTSNIKLYFDALDTLTEMFSRSNTDEARTNETPFSYVNPFKALEDDTYLLPVYKEASRIMPFASGVTGPLETLIQDEDFDMNQTLDEEVWDDETSDFVTKPYKVWDRMLIEAYTGVTDDSIFDPSIVKDAILFGEEYSDEVQEVVDDLCRYHADVINYEKSRVDWCFIRTPNSKTKTITQVLNWADGFGNKEKKNINMHPICGSWRFLDETTGNQERFNAFFDFLGEDGVFFKYLKSATPRSFASGTYSVITKGATNSQLLVPRTSTEREALKDRDIMYFRRRSDGTYSLGDDSGYNIGFDSVLKSLGSNIQFNRIMNTAYLILRDNRIINPTSDELEILKRKIETAIAQPMKHFNDMVKISLGVSSDPEEAAKKVVLCEITVTGHEYSRYNRLHMISQRPSTSN